MAPPHPRLLPPRSPAFPAITSLFPANHAGPPFRPAPEPTSCLGRPLPPAVEPWLRKDGPGSGQWLLPGAVPGGLCRAPAARAGRGRLAANDGDPGHQHLPAAGPGSGLPAAGPRGCRVPGQPSRGAGGCSRGGPDPGGSFGAGRSERRGGASS